MQKLLSKLAEYARVSVAGMCVCMLMYGCSSKQVQPCVPKVEVIEKKVLMRCVPPPCDKPQLQIISLKETIENQGKLLVYNDLQEQKHKECLNDAIKFCAEQKGE